MDYYPLNWYWIVGTDNAQVFSSVIGSYVPITDPTYIAWLAAGGRANPIPTETELGSVLAKLSLRPTAPGVLDGYLTSQAKEIASGVGFKPIFYLMQQVAALNGDPHPTVDEAIAYTKSVL